jgi:hypothetical protein
MSAPTIEAEFKEWLSRVYGPSPTGEQAAQIEMAFYAGAAACGYILSEGDALKVERPSAKSAAAIESVRHSIRSHAVRMQQNGSAAVKH